MTISVQCACGAKLKARDSLAGKKGACPKCKRPIVVPAAAPQATRPDAPKSGGDLNDPPGLSEVDDLDPLLGNFPSDGTALPDANALPGDVLDLGAVTASEFGAAPSARPGAAMQPSSHAPQLASSRVPKGPPAKDNRVVWIAAIGGGAAVLLIGAFVAWRVFSGGGKLAENAPAKNHPDSAAKKQTDPARPVALVYDSYYQKRHDECLPLLHEHAPNVLRLSEVATTFRFGSEYGVQPEDYRVLDESMGEKFDEVVELLNRIRQTAPAGPVMIHTAEANGFYLSRTGQVVIMLGRKVNPNYPYRISLGEAIIRNLTLVEKASGMKMPQDLKCDNIVDHLTEASFSELLSTKLEAIKSVMIGGYKGIPVGVQVSPRKGARPKRTKTPMPGSTLKWLYVSMDTSGSIDWSILDEA